MTPYHGLPTLYLAHNAMELQRTGDWYRNFEYDAERERGLDFVEDLFNPFVSAVRSVFKLSRCGYRVHRALATSYERMSIARRRSSAVDPTSRLPRLDDEFTQSLTAATEQYIVSRGETKTVIAGYHWFSDWGRDTMISLPGLTLLTGKHDVARSILRTFAEHVDQGLAAQPLSGCRRGSGIQHR